MKLEKITVEIYDIAGRMMFTKLISLSAGEQNIQVDMSGLQKGSYTLKLSLGGKTSTQMINKF